MIQISNQRLYSQEELSFGDYLKLPGLSHSAIKAMQRSRPIKETEKMNFGTMVHNYLLEPHKYEHSSPEVKSVALKLKEKLGTVLEFMKPEMAVTCNMHHSGLTVQYKGRGDLVFPGRLIIDIKIINGKSIFDTLNHFGYPNQLSGYAIGFRCPAALIAAYSTATKQTQLVNIPVAHEWWQEQILANGI